MVQNDRRIALVTGANKGIGLEIARQLGAAGVTVMVGARDAGRGEAAVAALRGAGTDARFLEIDVTDAASVAAAAATIDAEHGRLDILVNNAGINAEGDGPPGAAAHDAVRRLFETNFMGALTVSQAMLPLLRRSRSGRIVNVSSSLGSLAMNGDPSSPYYAVRLIGYNASKASLNMLTVQLAQELRDTPILVNAACPGYVRTDLNGNTGYVSPEDAAKTPVRLALLEDGGASGTFRNVDGPVPW